MTHDDIQTIADKLGLTLTERGNLEIGSHDCGEMSPPGGSICMASVTYYLLADGDCRVVIDDRYGSNQGYYQWHGGGKVRMDGEDLPEAIQLAHDHIESLGGESAGLMRAWRIASSEARANMRRANK